MTKMKDDITAHISNLLAPLKATVERHEIRWENQCQALVNCESSADGQFRTMRNVDDGTPLAPLWGTAEWDSEYFSLPIGHRDKV